MKVIHTPALPADLLRQRYDALPPIRERVGERTWSDRLQTFDDFMKTGGAIAHWIRFDARPDNKFRALNPALWDLVVEAFPQDGAER